MWCSGREISASSRPVWSMYWVPGYPGLHHESLSREHDSLTAGRKNLHWVTNWVSWIFDMLLSAFEKSLPSYSILFFHFGEGVLVIIHPHQSQSVSSVCNVLRGLFSLMVLLQCVSTHFGVSDYTLRCLCKSSFISLPMLLVCQTLSFQGLASLSTIHVLICLCLLLQPFCPKDDTSGKIIKSGIAQ